MGRYREIDREKDEEEGRDSGKAVAKEEYRDFVPVPCTDEFL